MLTALGLAAAGSSPVAPNTLVPGKARHDPRQRRIEEFGAVGDGRTDDTAAFERALADIPAGGVLLLGGGHQYRLTRSLVFIRPLVVLGGTKEHTSLVFDDGHYAELGGVAGAIIMPHDRGLKAIGTARRSVLSGFTIAWIGQRVKQLHGCLISTPVYLSEIDINAFPNDGFHIEAESARISGNANGSSFTNCSARQNGGNGFSFEGNDANACLLLGARAFDNRQAGFHDDSLLGNSYIAGEVDGNLGAGYFSVKETPNRSIFLGCYAEPNQRYDLNDRNLVLGGLGHIEGSGASMMRALPSGDLFSRTGHVFAGSEAIATGRAASRGGFFRTASDGFDLRSEDGQRLRLTKLLSANYVDMLNGNRPLIRFPAKPIAGNVTDERPWLPGGLSIGESGQSAIAGAGRRPPTTGRFSTGALWLNEAPKPGGFVGWVCVAPGQPGRWCAFGRITDGA